MVLPASQIMTTTRSTASARKGSALNCAEPVHIEETLFSFVVCFVVVTSRSTWNLEVGPTFIERTILFHGLLVWDTSYFTTLSAYLLITEFFYVIWLQQNRIIFKWSWSSICTMVLDYFRAFPWIKFTFCIVSFYFYLVVSLPRIMVYFFFFFFFSLTGFYYVLSFVLLSFVPSNYRHLNIPRLSITATQELLHIKKHLDLLS